LRCRRILLEYLNFLYYKEYNSVYEIRYSNVYGFHIVTVADILRNSSSKQFLHGITAYICVPKGFKDDRSIIEINRKCFELHGPGSLVLVGCPNHQYCKFPSFLSYSSRNKESISHKIVPNTSKIFTYLLLKNIDKGKSIRCFYGNQYEINENFVCERGNCVFHVNNILCNK